MILGELQKILGSDHGGLCLNSASIDLHVRIRPPCAHGAWLVTAQPQCRSSRHRSGADGRARAWARWRKGTRWRQLQTGPSGALLLNMFYALHASCIDGWLTWRQCKYSSLMECAYLQPKNDSRPLSSPKVTCCPNTACVGETNTTPIKLS